MRSYVEPKLDVCHLIKVVRIKLICLFDENAKEERCIVCRHRNQKRVRAGGGDDVRFHGSEGAVERGPLLQGVRFVGNAGPLDFDALLKWQDANEFEEGSGVDWIQPGDELLHQGHAFVGRIGIWV